MNQATRKKAVNRLKSATGHLQGVIAMLEEGRYCIDVIRQLQAVQAALEKTGQMVLDSHLHTCVLEAVRGEDADARERVLEEVMEVFRSR